MKVIIVKPFTQPYITEIKGDLESMQAVVGGYIQAIYPFDDEVALVCNEEGKINGLMPNRFLLDRNAVNGFGYQVTPKPTRKHSNS